MVIKEKRNIHVGYAACPTCGTVCTAHKISDGHVGYEDWQNATLDYYCVACKSSFQKQGDYRRWLTKHFREFSSPTE
jgi:hypothetical protein